MKHCNYCKIEKPKSEFRSTGAKCKQCHKKHRLENKAEINGRKRKLYKENPEPIKQRRKDYYNNNREEIIKKIHLSTDYRARTQRNFKRWISAGVSNSRPNDKRAGREHTITSDYVMELVKAQDYKCAVTGIPMVHQYHDLCSASIDRIDNSVGHVEGNIQVVCAWVNLARRHHSIDMLQEALDKCFESRIRAMAPAELSQLRFDNRETRHLRDKLLRKDYGFEFADLDIKEIDANIYRPFYAAHHYMGKSGRTGFTLGAFLGDKMVASGTISTLTRAETATKQGLDSSVVREFCRFCIHPNYQKFNFATWMSARIIRAFRKREPSVKLLVSFADTTVGHNGGMYLAGNWKFDGPTAKSYNYRDDDGDIHKKTVYNRARKAGITEGEYVKRYGLVKVKHKIKQRYLYWLQEI